MWYPYYLFYQGVDQVFHFFCMSCWFQTRTTAASTVGMKASFPWVATPFRGASGVLLHGSGCLGDPVMTGMAHSPQPEAAQGRYAFWCAGPPDQGCLQNINPVPLSMEGFVVLSGGPLPISVGRAGKFCNSRKLFGFKGSLELR